MPNRSANGRRDGTAAVGSSVIAFLVAGVLFMASVVAVLVTTKTGAEEQVLGDAPQAAAHRVQADSLASVLLGSPGFVTDAYLASYASTHSGEPMGDWTDGASGIGKTEAADRLTRLGLVDAQSPVNNMLDFAKFQNLRAAPLEANANDGLVNYEEAVVVLGLESAGVDFHVRAYPALQSVQDLLACQTVAMRPVCKDPNLKVTYIGDVQPPSTGPPPPAPAATATQLGDPTVTCLPSPVAKAYRISTTVTNGGTAETQFRGVFDVAFSAGPGFSKAVKTPILSPGEVAELFVDVPAWNGRLCGVGTTLGVDLYDSTNKLLEIDTTLTSANAVPAVTPTSDKDLWTDSATYFLTGSVVDVNYDGSQIDARGKTIGLKGMPLFLTVRDGDDPAGTLRFSCSFTTATNGKGGTIPITGASSHPGCPTTTLPAGEYTARLFDGSSACSCLVVTTRLIVVGAAPGPYLPPSPPAYTPTGYIPMGPVASETSFLESLVQQFCPTYWDSKTEAPNPPAGYAGPPWDGASRWTTDDWDRRCQSTSPAFTFKTASPPEGQPGDIFPDSDKQLREGLVPRLLCQSPAGCPNGRGVTVAKDQPRYDIVNVLVVGTGVDHNEMAAGPIKYPIEDWVKGGGTLIVLGSPDQAVNWLMPILKTGIKSSSGGVSVPDAAHPILHVPDELDYAGYYAHDQVWDFRGSHDADELFTQVVAQGGTDDYEPILAVSNPGAIQDPDTGTSGTVILTTWRPYDLFGCGTCSNRLTEGQKFMNNLLMLGYGDLYLDYGPPIPADTNVIPAVRFAQIQHPDFADPVQLKMNVFVFGR